MCHQVFCCSFSKRHIKNGNGSTLTKWFFHHRENFPLQCFYLISCQTSVFRYSYKYLFKQMTFFSCWLCWVKLCSKHHTGVLACMIKSKSFVRTCFCGFYQTWQKWYSDQTSPKLSCGVLLFSGMSLLKANWNWQSCEVRNALICQIQPWFWHLWWNVTWCIKQNTKTVNTPDAFKLLGWISVYLMDSLSS